jgi:hypothetical protein
LQKGYIFVFELANVSEVIGEPLANIVHGQSDGNLFEKMCYSFQRILAILRQIP